MLFLNNIKKEDECKMNEIQKQNENLKVKVFKLNQQIEGNLSKRNEHEEEIKKINCISGRWTGRPFF